MSGLKLRRVETGWYTVAANGHRWDLVNMAGESVYWTGLHPKWVLRCDDREVTRFWTLREGRADLAETLARIAQ